MEEQRRPDEAKEAYRKAIEIDPKDAAAYNNLGILLAGWHPQEAEKLYRKAIEINPKDTAVYNNLAILLAPWHPDEAEKVYRKAIEIDPRDATAYFNLAALLRAEGRRQEAEKTISATFTYSPGGFSRWPRDSQAP
jgi:Flp pilus assembly protein TadD